MTDARAVTYALRAPVDDAELTALHDTAVLPAMQGRGVGRELVRRAAQEVRSLGYEWLHVDYEADAAGFYEQGCGFAPTPAGLIRLAALRCDA